MEKALVFSEPFISADLIQDEQDISIQNKSIIINIDSEPLKLEDISVPSMKSIICNNTIIKKTKSIIQVNIPGGDYNGNTKVLDKSIIENSWHLAYNLFNLPQLRNTKLWRSEKATLRNIELNLWYASAGTDCGLHVEHDFMEIHTQIYGFGKMQKFHENDMESLYQEVYMSPGYSHDPFFTESGEYPWHQYQAITDCIWMAIEIH